MRIERVQDQAILDLVFGRVKGKVMDDFMPDDIKPNLHPAIIYLACWDGKELLGLNVFMVENSATLDAHSFMLPNSYGDRGVEAGKKCLQWIWDNTPFVRVEAAIPDSNPHPRKWVEKLGFTKFGESEGAWWKHGKLWNVQHFGVRRPNNG